MRSKIVAGNWKMNKNLHETVSLVKEVMAAVPETTAEVMVAPTFVNLAAAVEASGSSEVEVIAQNMHFAPNGAYTGEIAPSMTSYGLESSLHLSFLNLVNEKFGLFL